MRGVQSGTQQDHLPHPLGCRRDQVVEPPCAHRDHAFPWPLAGIDNQPVGPLGLATQTAAIQMAVSTVTGPEFSQFRRVWCCGREVDRVRDQMC